MFDREGGAFDILTFKYTISSENYYKYQNIVINFNTLVSSLYWLQHSKETLSIFCCNLKCVMDISWFTDNGSDKSPSIFSFSSGTTTIVRCRWNNSAIMTVLLLHLQFHNRSKFLVNGWSQRRTCCSLGNNLRIKDETGHCKYPIDTKANKHLLLSAGEQPMPQGSS